MRFKGLGGKKPFGPGRAPPAFALPSCVLWEALGLEVGPAAALGLSVGRRANSPPPHPPWVAQRVGRKSNHW